MCIKCYFFRLSIFQHTILEPDDAEITKDLPREILLRIFSFLDVISLCRCAQVSHTHSISRQALEIITLVQFCWCILGQPILEHSGTGWIELAENRFIRFSKRHRGMFRAFRIFCVVVQLTLWWFVGSRYWEYLTKMWWFLEVSVIAWLPISWRSIIEVWRKLFGSCHFSRRSFNCLHVYFRTLAQHCHNVERLDLSDCKKITDQATHAISKHCAKLTSINLESCVNISDKSLKDISDGCPVSFSSILFSFPSLPFSIDWTLNDEINRSISSIITRFVNYTELLFFSSIFPIFRISWK